MAKYSSRTIGFLLGALGASIFAGFQIAAILRSTSSTSPIGFIFVPIWWCLAFAVFFLFGYAIGHIRNRIVTNKIDLQLIVAAFFIVGFGGYLGKEAITSFLVMNAVSEVEQSDNNEKFVSVFNESFLSRNKFVLGAIAQKPTVSPELLDQIAHLKDPELYEAMGSLLPLLGKNGKGLAVMRLVVMNDNVSSETVEYLAANTKQEYVLGTIAGSPKSSEATLRKLEQEKNYLIDWGLAQNRKTPQDVFSRLLDRKKDFTHRTTLEMLLRNPSAPVDVQNEARTILEKFN
jgi:hypothetical protein